MKTRLLHKGRAIEKSERAVTFYFKKGDETGNIELKLNESNTPIPVHIGPFYGQLSKYFTILKPIGDDYKRSLFLWDLETLNRMLDMDEKIDRCEDFRFQVMLGEYVPVDLHHLLDHGFRQVTPGSYVALQVYDPVDNGEDGDAAYRHVKVSNVVTSSECLNCNVAYLIQTDMVGGTDTVRRDQIYEFVRHTGEEGELLLEGEKFDHTDPQLVGEIVKEIQAVFEFALSLSVDEAERKNNLIKRLCLKWKIDLSTGECEMQEKISQYISETWRRLKEAEEIKYQAQTSGSSGDTSTPQDSGGASYHPPMGSLARYVSQRQEAHRRHRENYEKEYQ